MKVDSSFLRLFRQSRYARSIEAELVQPKQNRRELFAVAATTFVLRHDRQFARHFLTCIAGVPINDLEHDIDVAPQAHACADLLIRDRTNGRCYVVEFKVHASIDPKQLPDSEEFLDAGGYLSQMLQRFAQLDAHLLTYTVLSKHPEFSDRSVNEVPCRAKTWKDVIPDRGESDLVADLLNSLGDFDIPVLKFRKIPSMKNSQFVIGTFQIEDLLESLLSTFRHSPLDVGSDEFYRWCGMPLATDKREFPEIRSWLGNTWKHFGWIGYVVPKENPQTLLSVWLYFASDHAANRAKTIENLSQHLPGVTIKRSERDSDMIAFEAASNVADDKAWFTRTLEVVLKHAVPSLPISKEHRAPKTAP